MSKGRKTLVFILLIIIIAQVVFLVVTLESTKSVQEEFDIQTKGLPAAKKILLAKNFYLSKYKKKPSSLADLGEFVDISKLLNEVSEKELIAIFQGERKGAKDQTLPTDLATSLEFFEQKLVATRSQIVDFSALRDPFRPYDPKPLEGATESRSPLETVDVSELNLTAVVESEGVLKAYVTLPTGQGFMIGKGDNIGRNNGQVTEVYSNKIVIVETVRDFSGNMLTKQREIFLRSR